MTVRKKVKISAAKRGHHESHKKKVVKTKQAPNKEKQIKQSSIFGKKRKESAAQQKGKKPNTNGTTSKNQPRLLENVFSSFNGHPKQKLANGGGESAKRHEEAYHALQDGRLDYEGETRELLPIKTKKQGIVSRSSVVTAKGELKKPAEIEPQQEEDEEPADAAAAVAAPEPIEVAEVTTTDLLLERDESIERQKFMIGVTCASILENPEIRIKSLGTLLDLVTETSQSGQINMLFVRKLAMMSIVELFKDIIPEYKLGIIDTATQKLKKTTLARVNYENELLLQYKKFLVLCENFTQAFQRKSRNGTNGVSAVEKTEIAETAVKCICDLLVAHPYFNYGMNIGQMLVTLLNNDNERIRKYVHAAFVSIFKTDNRWDVSKHIVRHINQLVKKKEHNVHVEMVSCLKYLQIKDYDINAEQLKEQKIKKLEAHKSRVINMSRKERKRNKKLAELEKELFETKAEESKQVKTKKLGEMTKLVFTIFFRILKTAPKSRLLSETLEGLSKFAHTINIEFFSDLIEVLNNLLVHAELGYREQLHCIQTVFTIFKGQGEVLNIDPARFYTHLYRNLLSVHAGKNHEDLQPILNILDSVLLKRRNNITHHRYLAFMKRLSMMTLQLQHFGSLGCLGVMRSSMLLNSALEVLLDTESDIGSGKFDPEVSEPEFSNANCTSLYELATLHRHYHATVRRVANNVANGVPSSGPGMLPVELSKQTPMDLYRGYDSTKMAFNPPIVPPKGQRVAAERFHPYRFSDDGLRKFCRQAQNISSGVESFDFC